MNISIGRFINLAVVAAFAGTGLMQGAQQATFHLPVAAHWGQAVLPPGDYRMSFPDASSVGAELLIEGAGKTIYEIPLVTDIQNTSTSSYLKLRAIDGNYFIREFSSGPAGVTFTFSVPKTSRRQQVAKGENGRVVGAVTE